MAQIDRRQVLKTLSVASVSMLALAACSSEDDTTSSSTSATATSSAGGPADGPAAGPAGTSAGTLTIDNSAWNHDSGNDVYWQIGRTYVATPAAADYETLGVYVPGAYLDAKDNGDGTYTATVNSAGRVGDFTAATAPIVLPVNTPGYAAQKPPSSYSYNDVAAYLQAGFVYVAAGLRGRDSNGDSAAGDYVGNAPWGVTDLKAAVRYVRYNAALLPGDKDSIFVFGHSGGGAQCSVMGTTGDAALYTPYLDAIGAAMTDPDGNTLSDAVAGVMAWCPITSLDIGNASYEWNMGQFASTGTRAAGTWTAAYSTDLAKAFAAYVNKLRLRSPAGRTLRLRKSARGTYLAGSYYDHVVSVIEESLDDFLADTTFPYTPSNTTMAGMAAPGGTAGAGTAPGGAQGSGPGGVPGGMPTAFPTDGSRPAGGMPGGMPSGAMPSGGMRPGVGMPSGGAMPSTGAAPSSRPSAGSPGSTTTYKTVEAYIAHLNRETTWVRYDARSNTAEVLSLEGFVRSQKNATKDVGAFDGIDRGETENVVLGQGTEGLHFAEVSRDLISAHHGRYARLTGWKPAYAAAAYTTDFATTDSVGVDVPTRSNMYNPMYYLSRQYQGYNSTKRAKHWRIRTGIMQGDTANTTEINLALALQALGEEVDFATVWGQAHTMAERTGDAATNFIAWVKQSVA